MAQLLGCLDYVVILQNWVQFPVKVKFMTILVFYHEVVSRTPGIL